MPVTKTLSHVSEFIEQPIPHSVVPNGLLHPMQSTPTDLA